MNLIQSRIDSINKTLSSRLAVLLSMFGFLALASMVEAGGTATTMFDSLQTETDASIFGPLGQSIIAMGAAAGGIFAIIKGAWMMAALGIGIAALMFGAQLVANSSGFGALV